MSGYMRFTQTRVVHSFKRLNSSRNGNPRFAFTFVNSDGDKETMKTQPDSGWVYALTPDALVDNPVALTFHYTKTGRAVIDAMHEDDGATFLTPIAK
jgi:hypothetical protein